MRLAGKVAVITGSGGGQGKAATVLFPGEGAKVAVNDLSDSLVGASWDGTRGAGAEAIAVPAAFSEKGRAGGLIVWAVVT